MAQLATINPLNQFFALNGDPLNSGKLYFGEVNKDPEQYPVQMYWDASGLVPALQPIRTTSGYPARSGSPAILYCAVEYSLRVRQSNDAQVFYLPRAGSTGLQEFGQWTTTTATPSFVSTTSFTVTGDQTANFQPQRRARFAVTAGTVYGTISTAVYGALTTVTMIMDGATVLDSGLSSVDLGILTPLNPSVPTTYAKSDDLCAADLRLTLTTGVPVTTADVTGATAHFVTPYKGNVMQLYDGAGWVPHQFTELTQATTDTTKSPAAVANNSVYDIFAWNDAGTLRATRGPAWTSSTARGTGAGTTELEVLEGRYVNKIAITNGPAAQRGLYVGSVRSNGSATLEDSLANRLVWNYYNRAGRPMSNGFTTSRDTTNDFPGEINTEIRLTYVMGVVEDDIQLSSNIAFRNSGQGNAIQFSIAIDNTTPLDCAQIVTQPVAAYQVSSAMSLPMIPSIGYHYATLVGGDNSGTTTWSGGAAGVARCTLKAVVMG